ncbi:MAG: alpha/beta hydrolase [Bacteroidales bacterium]|nr:alpha/beta hydrolase [Bacteroidales bacterium]
MKNQTFVAIVAALICCACSMQQQAQAGNPEPVAKTVTGYEYARGIPYRAQDDKERGNEMCTLDVAYEPGSQDHPVVIWLHGGGLTAGRKEIPDALLRDSVVVVGVDYRLSPNVTIDGIIDDATAAVAWTMANIEQYGGDPKRIFLSGHSAGGYLAMMVGFDKEHLARYGYDPDSLAGIIPLSGQCITHFEVRRSQGIQPLQPTIDTYAPLYHVRGDCPPILIISGDRNKELYGRYEEQAYLWRLLQLCGHPDVTLYELDGYDHGGMVAPALPLILQFIKTH